MENLEDEWAVQNHSAVYEYATHSMSAVGILAPFIESLFVQIFSTLQDLHCDGHNMVNNDRPVASPKEFWNPKTLFLPGGETKTDIVEGIQQLSISIGLDKHMPMELGKMLAALFAYRNEMFHNGFEWPKSRCENFENKLVDKNWPSEWFEKTTTGSEPWTFYMSDVFIDLSLLTIDNILEAVGAYVNCQ